MRMYIDGQVSIGEATINPDPESKCLVCETIYGEYGGEMRDHVEEIRLLNDSFNHTLGPQCAVRARAEKDPFAPSVEELVENHTPGND